MKCPERLQGTDGVRGAARPSTDPQLNGLGSLEAFREKGIITEQFLELYAYAHVLDLRRKERLSPHGEVVIGWDPRDPEGLFTTAVVRGVRKGGAQAVVVGVLPTPAVVLYMLSRQAASALMVTASHNPADQNGVKIFLGPLGLKPLPIDDCSLTALINSLDYQTVCSQKETGGLENAWEEAFRVFQNFSLNRRNTWIEDNRNLQNLLLVVDPAWGAFSGIAAQIFRDLEIGEVVEVNGYPGREVNLNSGVAELEGTEQINARLQSPAGRNFEKNAAIQELFRLGKENHSACTSGERQIAAAIFDADGDRFYLVFYDPFQDRALVLSGDESAFHQARYLISRFPSCYRGAWYLNTVESDLNASRAASRLGYRYGMTGVGDKWLLWRAYLLQLEIRLDALKRCKETTELRKVLTGLSDPAKAEALPLSKLAETITLEGSGKEDINNDSNIKFGIANEESGHLLTQGTVNLKKGGSIPVFVGNGLKGAINTFAALRESGIKAVSPERMKKLHHPFAPGFKRTLYVYYSDKTQLLSGAKVRDELEGVFAKGCRKVLQKNETVFSSPFPEEPEMLYFGIFEGEKQRAGAFARNSGTEEKTAIYLRGTKEDEDRLTAIGKETLHFLMVRMKNPTNPYARAEQVLLERLQEQYDGLSEEELERTVSQITFPRLVKEMERQEFIKQEGSFWRLTSLGLWFLLSQKETLL